MDTQGMSIPDKGNEDVVVEYPPYKPTVIPVFTDKEREELKEIINEALDEREKRYYEHKDDSWLYRGTY